MISTFHNYSPFLLSTVFNNNETTSLLRKFNNIANDTLWISVKNTSTPVKITNGTIPTSKEPKEEHGYGLPRIQSILDQLGAEYAFDYKDGWFTFVAEIPL